MVALMECRLPFPGELKGLLSSVVYSEETKSSAIEDFIKSEKDAFEEYLEPYKILGGSNIVEGSLEVDEVELEGKKGTAHISFQEYAHRSCAGQTQEHLHSQSVRFEISQDEVILDFYAQPDSDEPEL